MHYQLLLWFIKNHRDFPWRQYCDPYRIMIAEFMLHRTRAEQVTPIYETFIDQYPDIFSLSTARESDIQKITAHLGLHWRSSHFINSAKFVIEHFNGIFPCDRKELKKIPGVGDYVAGAILTVCFNKSEYVIDSNIARFINRFFGFQLTGEIRRKKKIIEAAKTLFSINEPGRFLFAILDFTFKICKARNPFCYSCILNSQCQFKP